MSKHTIHLRRHALLVGLKIALILGILAAIQRFLGSAILEQWSGFSFVHATGMNTAPLDWLVILFSLFFLSSYHHLQEEDVSLPSIMQIIVSLFGVFVCIIIGFLATHPSDATYEYMSAFILEHRLIGGPLFASYLSSMMTLSVVPLQFLFFSWKSMKKHSLKLFLIFIGLQACLFVTLLEAIYHSFFSPYLLATVHTILLFFLKNVYIDPARYILRANDFLVRVGPACSGLSFLILFVSFFIYLLLSFAKKSRIRVWRAVTVFIGGVISLFYLNALRIAAIMIVGTIAPHLAMNLFHSAIGAVLFFLFFLTFLPLMKRWVAKR